MARILKKTMVCDEIFTLLTINSLPKEEDMQTYSLFSSDLLPSPSAVLEEAKVWDFPKFSSVFSFNTGSWLRLPCGGANFEVGFVRKDEDGKFPKKYDFSKQVDLILSIKPLSLTLTRSILTKEIIVDSPYTLPPNASSDFCEKASHFLEGLQFLPLSLSFRLTVHSQETNISSLTSRTILC